MSEVDKLDFSVGIKNALERGESLEKIKRSYLNAGYSLEEVEASINKLSGNNVIREEPKEEPKKEVLQVAKPTETLAQKISPKDSFYPPKFSNLESKPLPIQKLSIQEKNKEIPTTLILALIVLSLLILVGAAILGLYWDTLF